MAEKVIADRRLYRTADGRVVEAGDPDAAFLVAVKGRAIPAAALDRYGLSVQDGKVVLPEAKARSAPENKMAPKPEDKSAAPEGEKDESEDEWDMKLSPEEYLERFPDGPNAEAARKLVGD